MLEINSEGLKKLHFLKTDVEYLVVVATYTDEQEELLSHLEDVYRQERFDTYDLAEWCAEQGLVYRVIADVEEFGVEN